MTHLGGIGISFRTEGFINKPKSDKRIYLIGSNGKLGREFSDRFKEGAVAFSIIDTRNLESFSSENFDNSVIVDASGKNRGEEEIPNELTHLGNSFIELLKNSRCVYIKFSTCLILHRLDSRINYIRNSEEQIRELIELNRIGNSALIVLLLHSVYGGKFTDSFVDHVKVSSASGMEVFLKNPNEIRDFVNIDELYKAVMNLVYSEGIDIPQLVIKEVGTGRGYRLKDIVDFAYRVSTDLIPHEFDPTLDFNAGIGHSIVAQSNGIFKDALLVDDVLPNFMSNQ